MRSTSSGINVKLTILSILLLVTDIVTSSEQIRGEDPVGDDQSHEDSEEGSSRTKCRCVYAWMAKTSDVMSPGELIRGRVYTRPRKKDHFWGQPRRYPVLETFIEHPEPQDSATNTSQEDVTSKNETEGQNGEGDKGEDPQTKQENNQTEPVKANDTIQMGKSMGMGFFAPETSSIEKNADLQTKYSTTKKPTKPPHRHKKGRHQNWKPSLTEVPAITRHNSSVSLPSTRKKEGEHGSDDGSLSNKKLEKRSNKKPSTKKKSKKRRRKNERIQTSSSGNQNSSRTDSSATASRNSLGKENGSTSTATESNRNSITEAPTNKAMPNSTIESKKPYQTPQRFLDTAMVIARSEGKIDVKDENHDNMTKAMRRRRRKRNIVIKMICP